MTTPTEKYVDQASCPFCHTMQKVGPKKGSFLKHSYPRTNDEARTTCPGSGMLAFGYFKDKEAEQS